MKALEKYKAQLTEDLPIDGLDLADGDIRVHGVPWATLNTAQKTRLAVTVATLRFKGKDFRPVIVDNAEHLVGEQFDMLVKELEAAGADAILARAVDTDLIIEHK